MNGSFGQPTPRDSGSVDGGVDLYSDCDGLGVECKFISKDVDQQKRVEQEWSGIRDKLSENLRTKDGHATPDRAPYEIWADTQRPIKKYIFATSARLANEAKRRILETQIQQFFRNIIGSRGGYGHLRQLEVQVLDWTQLYALTADATSLVFRWLRQWPPGFAELDGNDERGFREFLRSEKLPYFSRDCWQALQTRRDLWTESALISELCEPANADPFIVLIGKGGVGKTRFGLESARRMRELGWWTVQCNGVNSNIGGLRQLLAETPRQCRLVLFVDYLENFLALEGFIADIIELNQTSGHQIRVIATCRESFRSRVPQSAKLRSIGLESGSEAAFTEAATKHILASLNAGDTDVFAEKCRFNLALAAFLLFLNQDRSGDFALELSELREEEDFGKWIIKRLQKAGITDVFPVAAVLAGCNIPVTVFDDFARSHGASADELRRVLVCDKWIERRAPLLSSTEPPVWALFHDVFADVLLSYALETAPDRSDAIDRLFDRAVKHGLFPQTLISLGRIRQTASLGSFDWTSSLLELERRVPGTMAANAQVLLANALLPPETVIEVIAAFKNLRDAIKVTPQCDVGLGRLAVSFAGASPLNTVRFDEYVLPLIDEALSRERIVPALLRMAFKVRPERYSVTLQHWVKEHIRHFHASSVLGAWLEHICDVAKRDPQLVERF